MTRLSFLLVAAVAGLATAKSIDVKKLPPAVQKTVQEQTKGAEIKNISKEKEKGAWQYEVETMRNGKHRDFNVAADGTLIVVEEEVGIGDIPAAAKAAIEKKVGTGKLTTVEAVTKGGTTVYEGIYTDKRGKKIEVVVKADGEEVKP
ncbi:MAG: hypothetical protein NTV52_01445 [Acidobacteria bacterium]|nr:hypothetical protein [Acidobacteriota bacterium]